jgi:SH3-like domain-containing protein
MKSHSRKVLLQVLAAIALAAAAVVVFLPAAQAAPGTVTTNVNVRQGPGTNYAVVDVVRAGTRVDVQQCRGSWCYIAKAGPDGWISASYLTAGGRPVNPNQPGLSFGFTIGGPNGSISIGIGQPNPPRPPRPPVIQPPAFYPEVCFFDRTRMRGDRFCLQAGDANRDLRNWVDRISSIDNPEGLQVQVCSEINFRNCRIYSTSANSLGDFDDYIASIRVR